MATLAIELEERIRVLAPEIAPLEAEFNPSARGPSLEFVDEMLDVPEAFSSKELEQLCEHALRSFVNGEHPLAFSIAEKGHRLFRENAFITHRLGDLYFEFERYGNAIPYLRSHLEANPHHFEIARRLHKSYLETGKKKHAKQLLDDCRAKDPANPNVILMGGYHNLYERGYAEALSCAEYVYAAHDRFPPAMLLKALALSKLERVDEASKWFDAYDIVDSQRHEQHGWGAVRDFDILR